MILSDISIKKHVDDGRIIIDPFDKSRITPAGYDLSAGKDILIHGGEHKLVATHERIELPNDLLAVLHLRSSFAREGLFASFAIVDPGFKGQLTVSLLNVSHNPIKIKQKERLLQLTFMRLSSIAERSYEGSYQESIGIVESKRKREL